MTTFLLEATCPAGHRRTVRLHGQCREAVESLAAVLIGSGNPLACKDCGRTLPPFTVEEVPDAPAHANGAAGGK